MIYWITETGHWESRLHNRLNCPKFQIVWIELYRYKDRPTDGQFITLIGKPMTTTTIPVKIYLSSPGNGKHLVTKLSLNPKLSTTKLSKWQRTVDTYLHSFNEKFALVLIEVVNEKICQLHQQRNQCQKQQACSEFCQSIGVHFSSPVSHEMASRRDTTVSGLT